jgi:hypothetical protein
MTTGMRSEHNPHAGRGSREPSSASGPTQEEIREQRRFDAEMRLLSSLANPKFPPAPEPRNIGQETRDTFQAMIDYAPRMFEMEKQYGPQYASIEAQTMKDVLTGNGGMLDFYSNEILPRSLADASRMRAHDVADIEKYGPRLTEAILNANPQQRVLLDELNRQAQTELGRGGDLSADQVRDVTQATRAAYSDRGMIRSGGAILDEVANRSQYSDARQAQRRDFAGRVLGMNQAVTGDPMMGVLGRPSGASPQAGAMLGVGQATASAGGPSGMFDPMNQYAAGVYGGNQQMASNMYGAQAGIINNNFSASAGLMGSMYGADRDYDAQKAAARAQRTGSILGGLFGGAGSAIGGMAIAGLFCWVAREVYGEQDDRWLKFRVWLHAHAPVWFYKLYARYGERFARWLKGKPLVKRLIRAWMDTKVKEVAYAL